MDGWIDGWMEDKRLTLSIELPNDGVDEGVLWCHMSSPHRHDDDDDDDYKEEEEEDNEWKAVKENKPGASSLVQLCHRIVEWKIRWYPGTIQVLSR